MAGAFREGSAPAEAPPLTSTPPLAQYLSLDPLAVGETKHSRYGELRRTLQVQADDQHDELRRIQAAVAESSAKARDKARSLQEAPRVL